MRVEYVVLCVEIRAPENRFAAASDAASLPNTATQPVSAARGGVDPEDPP